MSMKFCKNCGTLYDDSKVDCPRCTAKELEPDYDALAYDGAMDEAKAAKLRKKSWIQLIIGVPVLIGVIYLAGFFLKMFVG